jgi:SAM-dependent methyltransferase
LVSLEPLPGEAELAEHYRKEYWQEAAQTSAAGVDRLYDWRMGGVARRLAGLVPAGARLLDVGAGGGAFMRLCRRVGLEAWGLDKYADPGGDPCFLRGDLLSLALPEAHYDAVTFLHVLEHLADPAAVLAEALRILKPGGIVLVEAPNADSLAFKLFKSRWQPLELPTHFNFFSPTSLKHLVGLLGGARVVAMTQFSLRASPAALVLSLAPWLQPKRVRRETGGRYPAYLKMLYLGMQALALAPALLAAGLGRGCILRASIRKAP